MLEDPIYIPMDAQSLAADEAVAQTAIMSTTASEIHTYI